MSVYVIGDVQGCYESLRRLVDALDFDPTSDRLWFVGDLVNRGPDSLAVLRWVSGLGSAAVVVLGNHDLHLLAIALGVVEARSSDTVADVLAAPDGEELVSWMRRRPLIHREGPWTMIHAGIHPSWSTDTAVAEATAVAERLRSEACAELLRESRRRRRDTWSPTAPASDRLCAALAVLTRIRTCHADGRLDHRFKGAPEDAPSHLEPWYSARAPGSGETVLFGHWAALGHRLLPGAVSLDSGCVWGRGLTAFRLDDGRSFSVPSAERR